MQKQTRVKRENPETIEVKILRRVENLRSGKITHVDSYSMLAVPAIHEAVVLYAEDSPEKNFKDIGAQLINEPHYKAAVEAAFPKRKMDYMVNNVVKTYFVQKYGIDDDLLQYYDFNIDKDNKPVKNKVKVMADDIRKGPKTIGSVERDKVILRNSLSIADPMELRIAVLAKKSLNLSFSEVTTAQKRSLTEAFIKFHTDYNAYRVMPDYTTRLGQYYHQVGKILGDTIKAIKFIDDNFKFLVQPPAPQLPGGKPYLKPNCTQIFAAIQKASKQKGANKNEMAQMAECFRTKRNFFDKYPQKAADKNSVANNIEPAEKPAGVQTTIVSQDSVPVAKSARTVNSAVPAVADAPAPVSIETLFAQNIPLTKENANQLDTTAANVGGTDNLMAILQYMEANKVTAVDIVEQQEARKAAAAEAARKEQEKKKIDELMQNFDIPPEVLLQYLNEKIQQANGAKPGQP